VPILDRPVIDLLGITGECWAMPDLNIEDWEAKAARAGEAADRLVSPNATRIMLEIVRFYDALASEARDDVFAAGK
jgi:hypothetical protein